jgi:hypothetical protein
LIIIGDAWGIRCAAEKLENVVEGRKTAWLDISREDKCR